MLELCLPSTTAHHQQQNHSFVLTHTYADPDSQRLLDFWLLIAMLTLGAERRRAVEMLLRWVGRRVGRWVGARAGG